MKADEDRARLIEALSRVATGDRASLRVVYGLTSSKLFGICLRILGDRAEAEDVLQETYISVWNRAGAFDAGRGLSPITWLATIARNRAIDRLRAGARNRGQRPIDDANEIPDASIPADVSLEIREQTAQLRTCLDELEPHHAKAIRTAFYDGLTYEALAERMEVPVGTMKSWIRRSLQRLRACLESAADSA